ncbi:MAG: hypothetical protein WDM89_00815 [Rhizomicrobium sp.]
MSGTALPTDRLETHSGTFGRQRLVRMASRYSLSAIGPVAVSGAHFLASLIILHHMTRPEFGQFSFLLVVVPFGLSLSSGLLGAPLVSAIGKPETVSVATRASFRAVNRIYCLLVGLVTAASMFASGAGDMSVLLLGVYGAAMAMRWFARCTAYYSDQAVRAAVSDLVYSVCLVAGLLLLVIGSSLTMMHASIVLMVSALLGLLPFGWDFLRVQFGSTERVYLAQYRPIWRDVTRWSLLGVALSEVTANAHAYLVTFILGTHAFAPLAAGALLIRPLSLVLTALPDRERPLIAHSIAAGNMSGAVAAIHEFRLAASAAWLGTVLLSIAVFLWFPRLVIRDGFDPHEVMMVVALWIVIVAARAVRAGDATFLQGAGAFDELARVAVPPGVASLLGTLLLLLIGGPVWSLGGIMIGEWWTTFNIFALKHRWMRARG